MGGWSSEREISMMTGKSVLRALETMNIQVTPIVVERELDPLIKKITSGPEVIFNALHGTGGEDGQIQALLDILKIPYTHSGLLSSALAMNKILSKRFVSSVGVQVPSSAVVAIKDLTLETLPLPLPVVIKPINNGSTIGVVFVDESTSEIPMLEVWENETALLVESYIPGRELTVGVLGDRSLAVTEIVLSTPIFDYHAKYTPGKTTHLIPAPLDPQLYDAILDLTSRIHQLFQCRGVTRTDFRYDDRYPNLEGLYFLEINTHPGLTETSLIPEQAAHAGISFPNLIYSLIQEACIPQQAAHAGISFPNPIYSPIQEARHP